MDSASKNLTASSWTGAAVAQLLMVFSRVQSTFLPDLWSHQSDLLPVSRSSRSFDSTNSAGKQPSSKAVLVQLFTWKKSSEAFRPSPELLFEIHLNTWEHFKPERINALVLLPCFTKNHETTFIFVTSILYFNMKKISLKSSDILNIFNNCTSYDLWNTLSQLMQNYSFYSHHVWRYFWKKPFFI